LEITNLFIEIRNNAEKMGSLYRGNIQDRQNVISFIEMNDWFGHSNPAKETSLQDAITVGVLLMDSGIAVKINENLELWLQAYSRSNEDKLDVLVRFGESILPLTTDSYIRFIKGANKAGEPVSWKLLDYLLSHLNGELCDMGSEEIHTLVSAMGKEASLSACQLFGEFYEHVGPIEGKWLYRFGSRSHKDDLTAYSIEDFGCMMYCTFNEEHWANESMLEKACGSAVYANLWAFIAMHFVCALRATDIIRLPKPILPCSGEEFRRGILNGGIKDPGAFSRDMKIRLELKHLKPNKTSSVDGVPDLKLFIPTSLERPLGMIISIAASFCDHIKAGFPFIHRDTDYNRTKRFFGPFFANALDRRCFSTNRANKAYLQGIEMVGDNLGEWKPKGYMLAAIARSHKGGIATFPVITERYLKDNVFSGYSPQFIAREMFERGVFGFIPHLLLQIYKGDDYKTLRIDDQTALIKELGIKPVVIEELVRVNQRNLWRAQDSIRQVVSRQSDIKIVLLNIASGRAISKDDDALCLMTACGFPCVENTRPGCIGCRYEIYTKALLHRMVSEYTRLKGHFMDADGWRYKAIARETIMPMVGEFIATMRLICAEGDVDMLTEIIEGGLRGYDNCNKSVGGSEL